jgi:chorismate synthase
MSQASQRGSVAHDAIAADSSHLIGGGFIRRTDHAGGLEGGISSGAPIIAKVAMKPLSTLNRPVLETVDLATGESTISFKERTDVTAVPALGVVAEAMMAIVVANEALRKFGGDSVEEFVRNHDAYVSHLGSTASAASSD